MDLGGGPEGVSGLPSSEQRRKVARRQIIKTLESVDKGAELNTLFNREPVKLVDQWRHMSALRLFENEPRASVLYPLQTTDVFLRGTTQKRATIVQLGQDKGPDSMVARIKVQESSDSTKIPDLEIQGARQLGNMLIHLHMAVKDSAQISNRARRVDLHIIKMERVMLQTLIIKLRGGDEKLSFFWIHHKLVVSEHHLQLFHTAGKLEQGTDGIARDTRVK